jgi:hypothetical protein
VKKVKWAVKKVKYPISKYVGKYPNGKWVFIKEVKGSYEDAMKEAAVLQKKDPKNAYRIWDERTP